MGTRREWTESLLGSNKGAGSRRSGWLRSVRRPNIGAYRRCSPVDERCTTRWWSRGHGPYVWWREHHNRVLETVRVVEDMRVAAMLRSKLWSRTMSEQIWQLSTACWSTKRGRLVSDSSGLIRQTPFTDCSRCGNRQKLGLSARTFDYGWCGLLLDGDHNAAANPCARGGLLPRGGLPALARAGHRPVVTRTTNFCRETEPPTGRRREHTSRKPYAIRFA